MFEALKKRLHSRTYWVAMIGSILTIIEANYGVLDSILPDKYKSFGVLIWPIAMVFLRELTTQPVNCDK